MTVHLMTPQIAANQVGSRSIARSHQSRLKSFFDDLINVTPPPPLAGTDASVSSSANSSPLPRKPRIVYVRDFNTLAASADHWYPALLQSVRQRRAGPLARTTSPVLNSTTIIFGVTPPVVPKLRPPGGSSGISGLQSAVNVLVNQLSASSSETERVGKSGSGSIAGKSEWGEDECSVRAREKRLKERLKKWEKDEKLLLADELPILQSNSSPSDDAPSRSGVQSSEGGFPGLASGGFGGPFGPLSGVLPGPVLHTLMGSPDPRSSLSSSPSSSSSADEIDESTSQNNFFRHSVVIPSQRSTRNEKMSRMCRRREINELTVRMAVASVGGTLPPLDVPFLEGALRRAGEEGIPPTEQADLVRMWDAWGCVVAVWSVVKQVADRALGSILIAQEPELQGQPQKTPKHTLDPTVVSWNVVARAFLTKASASAMRKHWAKETTRAGEVEAGREGEEDTDGRKGRGEEVDEVIERVKRDPDLDEHEQRLLGCIVDPRKSSTWCYLKSLLICQLALVDYLLNPLSQGR